MLLTVTVKYYCVNSSSHSSRNAVIIFCWKNCCVLIWRAFNVCRVTAIGNKLNITLWKSCHSSFVAQIFWQINLTSICWLIHVSVGACWLQPVVSIENIVTVQVFDDDLHLVANPPYLLWWSLLLIVDSNDSYQQQILNANAAPEISWHFIILLVNEPVMDNTHLAMEHLNSQGAASYRQQFYFTVVKKNLAK